MKKGFLDKLIERMDRLDSTSLQTYFLRLAKEKGLMETIFNAIQEGILVVDADGRLDYANHAAETAPRVFPWKLLLASPLADIYRMSNGIALSDSTPTNGRVS